jgi:hypothetical protein
MNTFEFYGAPLRDLSGLRRPAGPGRGGLDRDRCLRRDEHHDSRRSHCWAHSVFNQTDIRAPCLILKVTFKNTQRWRINNGPIGQSVIV